MSHRAGEVGPAAVAVIAELLAVNVLFRLRAVQGDQGLAEQVGPDRLEAACGKALTVGDAPSRASWPPVRRPPPPRPQR